MNVYSGTALQAIARDAQNHYPLECCGIIDSHGLIHEAENIAEKKTQQFRISGGWFQRQQREHGIAAIYHSHCDRLAFPSAADMNGLVLPELPYIVASVIHGVCKHIGIFKLITRGSKQVFEPTKWWENNAV